MRISLQFQMPIVHPGIDHEHARELQKISDILDDEPGIIDLVLKDIVPEDVSVKFGRKGMTAEQVIRALIVKMMNGYSYAQLAFHLADSQTYRAFCRIGIMDKPPSKSALQDNIKRIRARTLEVINRILVMYAIEEGIERSDKVRVDTTVTASNIHHPTDSSLLWDCVRVMTRIMHEAHELVGFEFVDHKRRAKRRAMEILNAKKDSDRFGPYKDLLKVTIEVLEDAKRAVGALKDCPINDLDTWLRAMKNAEDLARYIELTIMVIDQTTRRVVQGEKVPSDEKIVSIFEPHTDVIVKDRRDTYYGHKISITGGASNLVLDCVIEQGNPTDSTLATRMIQRLKPILGKIPRQASFDGGFASGDNLATIKKLGVEDVAFAKRRNLDVADMVKSTWVYRQLRNFRAGIEGMISFLKRCFGMDRCTWRSFPSFKAYVWSSVISANLLIMAKHMLA